MDILNLKFNQSLNWDMMIKISTKIYSTHTEQYTSGIFRFQGWRSISFYHPRSILMVSTFAWVSYSISRDRHDPLFRSTMHKWGLVPLANCRCGAEEQTAYYILASCPLYHLPNGTLGMAALDDDTVAWLQTIALCIWWNNRPKQRSNAQCIPSLRF